MILEMADILRMCLFFGSFVGLGVWFEKVFWVVVRQVCVRLCRLMML